MPSPCIAESPETLAGDLAAWRGEFQAHYADALRELQGKFAARPGLRPAWTALQGFLTTEGKRLRPILFLSTYKLLGPEEAEPPPAIFRAACALEFFHSFALAHDDIIDGSRTRRGQPTLHRRLAGEAGDRRGENLALVLGDILFGFAVENFLLPGLDPGRGAAALRYFATIAQDTGLGEALELALLRRPLEAVTEEDIRNTYHLKTTRYTFEAPLVVAAILAGAPEPVLLSLHDFARPLGLAFQIENDLHEIGPQVNRAAEPADDLREGVKTLFLKRYHDALPAAEAAALRVELARGNPSAVWARVRQDGVAAKVVADLKGETAAHFQESRQVLLAAPLRPHQRAGLLALAAFIQRHNRHSESEPAAASA
jgi:geranylgeranyl diphosphate synthase type I